MCAVAKARQQLGFKNAMQGVQRLAFAISLWLTVPHSTCVVSSVPYAHVKQIDAAASNTLGPLARGCSCIYVLLHICVSKKCIFRRVCRVFQGVVGSWAGVHVYTYIHIRRQCFHKSVLPKDPYFARFCVQAIILEAQAEPEVMGGLP